MPNLGYTAPDTPKNRREKSREQQPQHSKTQDRENEVTTAQKAIPVNGQLQIDPEPNECCRWDREKQRGKKADQPYFNWPILPAIPCHDLSTSLVYTAASMRGSGMGAKPQWSSCRRACPC